MYLYMCVYIYILIYLLRISCEICKDFIFTNVIFSTFVPENLRDWRYIAEINFKHAVVNARRDQKLAQFAYLILTIILGDWF